MYSFVAIACLLSVAVAAPSSLYGDIGLVGSVSVPKYGFNYAVSDPVTGDNKAQSEVRDGGVVKGSYSLTEPDGTLRIVDYTADSIRGFNAVVKRVGTAAHPQVWPVKQIAAPVAVAPAPLAVAPVSVAPAPVAYSNGPGWNGNGYGPDFLGLNILGLGLDSKLDFGLDKKLDFGLDRKLDLGLDRKLDLGLDGKLGLGMYGKLDLGLADIGLGSIDSGYDGLAWKH